jgi:hypothetical protein
MSALCGQWYCREYFWIIFELNVPILELICFNSKHRSGWNFVTRVLWLLFLYFFIFWHWLVAVPFFCIGCCGSGQTVGLDSWLCVIGSIFLCVVGNILSRLQPHFVAFAEGGDGLGLSAAQSSAYLLHGQDQGICWAATILESMIEHGETNKCKIEMKVTSKIFGNNSGEYDRTRGD